MDFAHPPLGETGRRVERAGTHSIPQFSLLFSTGIPETIGISTVKCHIKRLEYNTNGYDWEQKKNARAPLQIFERPNSATVFDSL